MSMADGGDRSRRRGGRYLAVAVVALLVLTVGAALGWAGHAVFLPASQTDEVEQTTTLVEVVDGDVEYSLSLNTSAQWRTRTESVNMATGFVTSVDWTESGAKEAKSGDTLYTVDMRPVVVAQGSVPLYTSVETGDTGELVSQIQAFLQQAGWYDGEVDGVFGSELRRAVVSWQRHMGVEATGVLRAGDLVFVPSLPSYLALNGDSVTVGATLAGGENAVRVLNDAPSFSLVVTSEQSGLIPDGAAVTMSSPDGDRWHATAGTRTVSSDGTGSVTIELEGDSICADQCAKVPFGDATLLSSDITVVATTSGLVVPGAAISTDAGGQTMVVGSTGQRIPVAVRATARGMSVVEGEGISSGMMVQIPVSEP